MSVYFRNFDSFIQKLKALDVDCDKAARNVVNRMVNEGMAETMKETPVGKYSPEVFFMTRSGKQVHFKTSFVQQGGTLRAGWKSRSARKQRNGYSGSYSNNVFYGLYVNYGHRLVRNGETIGYVPGFFMLEAGQKHVSRNYQQWMNTEIKNIKQKGGW